LKITHILIPFLLFELFCTDYSNSLNT